MKKLSQLNVRKKMFLRLSGGVSDIKKKKSLKTHSERYLKLFEQYPEMIKLITRKEREKDKMNINYKAAQRLA